MPRIQNSPDGFHFQTVIRLMLSESPENFLHDRSANIPFPRRDFPPTITSSSATSSEKDFLSVMNIFKEVQGRLPLPGKKKSGKAGISAHTFSEAHYFEFCSNLFYKTVIPEERFCLARNAFITMKNVWQRLPSIPFETRHSDSFLFLRQIKRGKVPSYRFINFLSILSSSVRAVINRKRVRRLSVK